MVLRKRRSENKFPESLEDRIQRLEVRLMALEAEVGHDDAITAWLHGEVRPDDYWLFGEMIPTVSQPIVKRGAGKPAKISDEEFATRRDRMVMFFEGFWPELERILAESYKSSEALKDVLLANFPGRDGHGTFQRIVANADNFLRCIRRTKPPIPRNFAYAMAGAPELTLRSSLDRCGPSRQPSELPVHFFAMKDHIRRRHPRWFARLLDESSTQTIPTAKS